MATSKNIKTVASVKSAISNPPNTNTPTSITVVVLDNKSQPASGVNVSITPSDASVTTNSSGEVQFKLGTATKYQITTSYGSNTVTVPYYVTQNGATRLVINPTYVKSVEQRLHPSSWFGSHPVLGISIILVLVIVFFGFWRYFNIRKGNVKNKKGSIKDIGE